MGFKQCKKRFPAYEGTHNFGCAFPGMPGILRGLIQFDIGEQ